jgi:hypothetical protein
MMAFFEWLETLSFSAWVRESGSLWAFPMFLFSHTLGMAMVAGGATLISMALLGVWPKAPIKPMEKFYPLMWGGFYVNAFTGVALFCADATTRAINPDFWVKLVFVAIGVWAMARMRKVVFADPMLDKGPVSSQAKMLAWVSIICWFGAICAGRLIAYVGPVAGV